jgi:hypothetical protein
MGFCARSSRRQLLLNGVVSIFCTGHCSCVPVALPPFSIPAIARVFGTATVAGYVDGFQASPGFHGPFRRSRAQLSHFITESRARTSAVGRDRRLPGWSGGLLGAETDAGIQATSRRRWWRSRPPERSDVSSA